MPAGRAGWEGEGILGREGGREGGREHKDIGGDAGDAIRLKCTCFILSEVNSLDYDEIMPVYLSILN